MAKTSVNTAANPAAGASTGAALASAVAKGPQGPRGPGPCPAGTRGPDKAWVCREDCLLADGFHYKDDVVWAAECPPHFGPVREAPERDE